MALDDILNRCIEKWRGEGIRLSPPIADTEVRRVWGGFGSRLSDDVLQLYTTVGGFEEYVFDEPFFWCLWPWDYLQKENAEFPREGVQFCDHSLHVVTWELRFEDQRHSSVWMYQPPIKRRWFRRGYPATSEKSSPDLESFFQTYLDDPWQLL